MNSNLFWFGFSMSAVGVLMMVGGIWLANRGLRGHGDPLAELSLSNAKRVEIRKQLRAGGLPSDITLRDATVRWARREATLGAAAFRWKWVYWVGLVFYFGALYEIRGSAVFVLAFQLLLAAFLGAAMSLSWRVVLACRALTTAIETGAIDPDRPYPISATGFGFAVNKVPSG
jgi:hypothetical protein